MDRYRFQWHVVFLMILAWSFGGLIHNCLAFLFPYLAEEFHLGMEFNGYFLGTLSLFWTLSMLFFGRIVQKYGQMKFIMLSLAVGTVAYTVLGVAPNVPVIFFAVALLGFGGGILVPSSLSFLSEQTAPEKRGLVFGLSGASFTLVGSAGGSYFFTKMGDSLVGWRGCFEGLAVLSVLLLVIFVLFQKGIFRGALDKHPDAQEAVEQVKFREIFSYKNMKLTTLLTVFAMGWYFTVTAFTILYLVHAKEYSVIAAGAVFAGFGLGGFIGEFGLTLLSDYLGRKRTAVLSACLGTCCFALFVFVDMPQLLMTFGIGAASFFMSGLMAILNSVVPSEAVPAEKVSMATSVTPAAGELVGGVVAPVLAGILSNAVGVNEVMYGLVFFPIAVIVGAMFLKETAPRVVARNQAMSK